MTPGIQSSFFLLLLLVVFTAMTIVQSSTVSTDFGHTSSSPSRETETLSTQSHPPSSSTERTAFNSSLEDPSTNYFQELQRNISELAVCQCRRKNYGQLDIFPTRDAYHPMSEYPTYHTHGRYVPPGSTSRSPYEEVSSGNGGSSLSYTNPAVAATSANL
ncbi:PREDICTED: mucin-1 isoform X16 [Propithecus coquereli]|uniref:mucin-1 isoform X16 n=1 Tax=Propithecus coquereli TaxID=379532 RepID=UPI00063FCE14|nr:PREDICTED: mucin-1 isoform X16 [Propithecus coquereli]